MKKHERGVFYSLCLYFLNFKVSAVFLAVLMVTAIFLLPVSAAPRSSPPKGNVDANFSSVNIGTGNSPGLRIDEKGIISNPAHAYISIKNDKGVKIDAENNNMGLEVDNSKGATAISGFGKQTGILGRSLEENGVEGIGETNGVLGVSDHGTGVRAKSIEGSGIVSYGTKSAGTFLNLVDPQSGVDFNNVVDLATPIYAIKAQGDVAVLGKLTALHIGRYIVRSTKKNLGAKKTETASMNSPCLSYEQALSCGYSLSAFPSQFTLSYIGVKNDTTSCGLYGQITTANKATLTLDTLCFDPSK
jgi:hypothetical protein